MHCILPHNCILINMTLVSLRRDRICMYTCLWQKKKLKKAHKKESEHFGRKLCPAYGKKKNEKRKRNTAPYY